MDAVIQYMAVSHAREKAIVRVEHLLSKLNAPCIIPQLLQLKVLGWLVM